MEYRPLGNSGLRVSAIGLVKAQFQLKQITGSGECVSPSSRAV